MFKNIRSLKVFLFFMLMLNFHLAQAASPVRQSVPPGSVSSSGLIQSLPAGSTMQPFIRYNVNFFGTNPNSSVEQSGLLENSAIMNLNCSQDFQTINLQNGQNYLTVPFDGVYYLYMNAMTQNQNGGSGEWNNIQFNMYTQAPGGKSLYACGFTTYQQGGESNVGTGYNYYNETSCAPMTLKAGTLIFVQTKVVSSGTHCSGNSVLLMSGALSLQSMPY